MKQGIFAVHKPLGITSQRAVQIVKRNFRGERVGHAGTLDPLAEGVLVIAVGRAFTKQLGDVVEAEKEYITTVQFGATSDTDDDEGVKTACNVAHIPSHDDVLAILPQFVGEITQAPPAFSAAKISGQEAYKRARRGEKFSLGEHHVTVKEIELTEYTWPTATLRVVTGPGVYVRALGRDIGAALNVGGYLTKLVRTRVGQFTLEATQPLSNFETEK